MPATHDRNGSCREHRRGPVAAPNLCGLGMPFVGAWVSYSLSSRYVPSMPFAAQPQGRVRRGHARRQDRRHGLHHSSASQPTMRFVTRSAASCSTGNGDAKSGARRKARETPKGSIHPANVITTRPLMRPFRILSKIALMFSSVSVV